MTTTSVLSDEEKEMIGDALQFYWLGAIEKLCSKDLGDLERKNYESIRDKSKALMITLGYITP